MHARTDSGEVYCQAVGSIHVPDHHLEHKGFSRHCTTNHDSVLGGALKDEEPETPPAQDVVVFGEVSAAACSKLCIDYSCISRNEIYLL